MVLILLSYETKKGNKSMYAVITGASSGIGRECARILAKRGYDLILVARRAERLLAIQKKLAKYYEVDVLVLPYDLSEPDNCMELYQKCKAFPVEILINNAGFGKVGEYTETDLQDEVKMIDTNVKALHILTKLFASGMKQGYIMNVASIAAFQPVPLMAAYGASKAYVLSLTKAVNYELRRAKSKVHVCALCPGPVDTEFDQVAQVRYSLNHITAKECAKAGIDGMFRKKRIIFPVTSTMLLSKVTKLAPDWFTLPIEYHLQAKKQ